MSVTISYPSTQFDKLYGPFVNLGAHLPPKDNSPEEKLHVLHSSIDLINTQIFSMRTYFSKKIKTSFKILSQGNHNSVRLKGEMSWFIDLNSFVFLFYL